MPFVFVPGVAEGQFGDDGVDRSGGAGALSVSARLLGRPLTTEQRGLFQSRRADKASSLSALGESAKKLGFATRDVRLDARSPQLQRVPLIVKLKVPDSTTDETRFAVLFGTVSGNRVQMIDYPFPTQLVPPQMLAQSWDGHGFYVSTSEATLPSTDGRSDPNSRVKVLVLPVFALFISIASALFWWFRERRPRNVQ